MIVPIESDVLPCIFYARVSILLRFMAEQRSITKDNKNEDAQLIIADFHMPPERCYELIDRPNTVDHPDKNSNTDYKEEQKIPKE